MLGESPQEEQRRARCRERDRLRRLCQPPALIRYNNDSSWNLLDRLLDGPEPKVRRWDRYSPWKRLVWWMWKAWTALQAQRQRLNSDAVSAA